MMKKLRTVVIEFSSFRRPLLSNKDSLTVVLQTIIFVEVARRNNMLLSSIRFCLRQLKGNTAGWITVNSECFKNHYISISFDQIKFKLGTYMPHTLIWMPQQFRFHSLWKTDFVQIFALARFSHVLFDKTFESNLKLFSPIDLYLICQNSL
jgi:hypothetical protein